MNIFMKPKTLLLSTAVGLMLLPATQAMAQNEPATAASEDDAEIVVTARKTDENLLDVPMGLTALSGEALANDQAYRLEDFVGKVPGLTMTETIGAQLVIRGIASTAFSLNTPVATYIDDTPLVGVGGFSGGSSNTPNLDTFDLNRVEVLKGPQGTLYGASAMGGVLKYVTNAPDPTGFHAKIQGGLSSTSHSDDGFGHNVHGMINVPLGDTLAFRAVGYHNEYQGYIDNPSRGLEDVNDMRVYGGRASLLWKATPDLSIRLTALNQQRRWDGMPLVEVVSGTLAPVGCTYCQARTADQPGEAHLQLYNATINWDFGGVALTSSTTYDKWRFRQFNNLKGLDFLVDILKGVPGTGTYAFSYDSDTFGDDFVQETRLSSSGDHRLNWQIGVYYTKKEVLNDQSYLAFNRITNVLDTTELIGSNQPTTYREYAAFANVNFEITPQFDVSLGGRYSDQKQTFEQIGNGSPSAPFTTTNDSVFTWSADARWRFAEGSMVYARVAAGFVPGGPNVAPLTPDPNFPATFDPSTTTNYEIGYKGSLIDNALTVEISAFLIDFDDIQVFQQIGIYNAASNASKARSKGVEWSLVYKPVTGLTLGFNGAYTNAKLTEEPPPTVVGRAGDILPTAAKWQLAGSADYKWPMMGVNGFVGADWRYLSSRPGELVNWANPGAVRQIIPGYHIFDLRAGVEADRWRLSFYVKNVGDSDAISYAYPETLSPLFRAFRVAPRTFGVDLSFDF